ncbi:type VI secretion system protein TssA [Niveispirillum sp. KHB5.9]|uniref:type VI secretion system protein TssA n=1 Tax=Niveispirillum sp. KHB5.9 TaxID=3400269 RepID=UPI003A865935
MPSVRVDLEDLLKPGTGATGCGPDLRYDPEFAAIETLAAGRPATEMGGARNPGVPPDWAGVWSRLPDLLRRSKDLRLAVMACRALAVLDGVTGAAQGLALIHGMLERFWPGLHPELDPEDNTPLARKHALQVLLRPQGLWDLMSTHVLIEDNVLGKVTVGALVRALADAPEAGEPTRKQAGLLLNDHARPRDTAREAAAAAVATLEQLSALFAEQQIAGLTIDPLISRFRQIAAQFVPVSAITVTVEAAPTEAAPVTTAPAVLSPNGIGSQDDVIAALDAICAYYAVTEPSSPVPLILKRARRLVGADFNRILRDLAATGIADFERVSGVAVPELPGIPPTP